MLLIFFQTSYFMFLFMAFIKKWFPLSSVEPAGHHISCIDPFI